MALCHHAVKSQIDNFAKKVERFDWRASGSGVGGLNSSREQTTENRQQIGMPICCLLFVC